MGRMYDPERDKKAVQRIWIESGWIDDKKDDLEQLDTFLGAASAIVSDINDEPECLVTTVPGDYLHTGTRLPFTAVSSVNTSRIARKQRLASALLAEALATAASNGSAVAGLGIFEQGFYDRLGFGTTVYERWIGFDPATLIDFGSFPAPVRIQLDDFEAVHQCLANRLRMHGSVNLDAPGHTRANMMWAKHGFGLGYKNGESIESMLWMSADNAESGPYQAYMYGWKDWNDIPAILSIFKSLSDQVQIFRMREPAYLQMQDYLDKPLRTQSMSRGSKNEQRSRAVAYHQIRILDVKKAVSAISINGSELSFNLTITDPAEDFFPDNAEWAGCSGEYTVTLGEVSSCKSGHSAGLETLESSINAFSRLWCGALSASALSVSGALRGPVLLLQKLDTALRFPPPSPDWDY